MIELFKLYMEAIDTQITAEMLKSQTNSNVDLRDFFTHLMIEEGQHPTTIGLCLDKSRPSIYSSESRFVIRYENDKEYRLRYDFIRTEFDILKKLNYDN